MRLSRFATLVVFVLLTAARVPAAERAPTFNKDVAPILFANCSNCHRPDEVGPFALLTYEDARKRARDRYHHREEDHAAVEAGEP